MKVEFEWRNLDNVMVSQKTNILSKVLRLIERDNNIFKRDDFTLFVVFDYVDGELQFAISYTFDNRCGVNPIYNNYHFSSIENVECYLDEELSKPSDGKYRMEKKDIYYEGGKVVRVEYYD